MWLKFLVGINLLLVSYVPLVVAEQFRVGPVYTETTDQLVEVSVVVEFDVPPGAVSESDFRLVADGKTVATAREIRPFKDSGQGLALVICVDVSGTMGGGPLADTQEALLSFLGKVRPQDRIALISFADEEKIESSFEDTREHLADAVRNLRPRGKLTRLYQTLYKALDLFTGAQVPKRRRIIVISDGKDEGSTESIRSVVDKSTEAPFTPIDAVGRGKIDERFAEALQGLARSTGGNFAHARPDRLTLTDAIDWIYLNLSETRSLVVYFPYERDRAGGKIQNASIELQRPGEEHPLSESILEEIPWPLEKSLPPPEKHSPLWLSWSFWLLLAAFLGVGLVVLIRRHRQKVAETGQRQQETPVSLPEPEILSPQPQPRPRESTVVGTYYFPIPAPGQPTAILAAVSGPLEGQQFPVEQEIFLIGVSPENDLCIAEDDYVSDNQAYLRYEEGSLRIFDRRSKNGTFVNQTEVPDIGFVLSLGDRIRVGMSTFEVVSAPK